MGQASAQSSMPPATDMDAADFNLIADFLAKRDLPDLTREAFAQKYGDDQADLMILFGGSILHGCLTAGAAFRAGIARHLMIVGGEGHTTPCLRETVARRYPAIRTAGRMESQIIADLFRLEFGLDSHDIPVETKSTNCGENAVFSLRLAKECGIRPKTVILLQDQTMQLRMDATFRKVWAEWNPVLINYASYRAHLVAAGGHFSYEGEVPAGMWRPERFMTLLLGEIPRLHDTPEGYGPRGKNYLCHVDIPVPVLEAFGRLQNRYGALVRKPWDGVRTPAT